MTQDQLTSAFYQYAPQVLGGNQSYSNLGSMQQGLLGKYNISGSEFNSYDPTTQGLILGTAGQEYSPLQQAQLAQKDLLDARVNNLNSFDWTGLGNLGLSAFSAINQYNQQNDQMKLYKQQLSDARQERTRKNNTRKAWASAFKNA